MPDSAGKTRDKELSIHRISTPRIHSQGGAKTRAPQSTRVQGSESEISRTEGMGGGDFRPKEEATVEAGCGRAPEGKDNTSSSALIQNQPQGSFTSIPATASGQT